MKMKKDSADRIGPPPRRGAFSSRHGRGTKKAVRGGPDGTGCFSPPMAPAANRPGSLSGSVRQAVEPWRGKPQQGGDDYCLLCEVM